ncbi:SDR family NAD(P)-dependent oxidoreductase [Actinoplanes solisilvae]|uniref:SDR family NAD(P)-dependent oxidoreductase n=1 Tax=Actinoplanes solisilvae TaxID=2486853 RepID=UPI000FDCAC9B|nr:SDR family NAD(P)-dependent oxidoreductase [Actinoplanes solisilvae]
MPETIVLTGASSGIGRATALILAGQADHLVLHGLGPESSVGAVRAAMRPGTTLTYLRADYEDLSEVDRLAAEIRAVTGSIDLLINNAARPGAPARTITAAGNEVTFQVNYLAPALLTTRLLDLVAGRVVNVASATHFSASLDLDDVEHGPHRYSPSAAYAYSKLALVTYTCWLAAHRPSPSIDVVSMHPGVIATGLLHAMFSITGDSPEHAAGNIRYVASLRDDNGTYYDERDPQAPNTQATDPLVQDRLHELTTVLTRGDARHVARPGVASKLDP